MGDSQQIIGLKFEAAKERCRALEAELARLDIKQWASLQGCEALRKFLSRANKTLLDFFEAEAHNPDLSLLSPYEQELRVHRACSLVSFLFEHLGILSGAEINQTSAEIALPLRRFVNELIPEAEVLLRGAYQLNYTIIEVAEEIRELFAETSFLSATGDLPKLLYVINVPPVEANDTLLSSILAHEAAHGIYKREKLEDQILPQVKIPDALIQSWAKTIVSQQTSAHGERSQTIPFPFEEVEVRRMLTESATSTIGNWVAEMCCDALALVILGPAYFFAFVHFFSTITMLDGSSESHPPPRLRIRLMCRYLETIYNFSCHPEVLEFVGRWKVKGEEGCNISGSLPSSLALQAISNEVINLISRVAEQAVPKELQFSQAKLDANIETVVPLLIENVPAIELRDNLDEGCRIPAIADLLNGGWYVKLARFEEFQSSLPEAIGADRFRSERHLHKLLLKCMELTEIKRRWDEVKAKRTGV